MMSIGDNGDQERDKGDNANYRRSVAVLITSQHRQMRGLYREMKMRQEGMVSDDRRGEDAGNSHVWEGVVQ